jgi:YVTN family beta-propeller protein
MLKQVWLKRLCILSTAAVAACTIGCSTSKPPAVAESSAVPESSAPRIYVTNEVSGDLTVIDSGTRRVIATVPLGKRPRGIHPSPDGKTLYVALSGSPIAGPGVDETTLPPPDKSADGIGVFDVAQNKLIKIIPGGSDPENFDISKDGKFLYISNEDTSSVSIVDVGTEKVLKSIKIGGEPEGVKVTPDGKHVFITSEEDGTIAVLDPAAGRIISTFKVGHRPRSIAFTPDVAHAYVNAENDGTVVLIDAKRYKQIKPISIGKPGLIKPMAVLMSADGKRLYVSTGRGHQVFAVDTATNAVVGSVTAGQRPWGIALSPDGKMLYSANGPSNDISFIDLATNTVTGNVRAGGGPWGVAVLVRQ